MQEEDCSQQVSQMAPQLAEHKTSQIQTHSLDQAHGLSVSLQSIPALISLPQNEITLLS